MKNRDTNRRADGIFLLIVMPLALIGGMAVAKSVGAQEADTRWRQLVEARPELSPTEAKEVVAMIDRVEALHAAAGVRCHFGSGDGDQPTILFHSDEGDSWGQLIGNVGVSTVLLWAGPAGLSAVELLPAGNVNVITVYGRPPERPAPVSRLTREARHEGIMQEPLVAVWSRTTQHLGYPIETQTRGECIPIPAPEGP